MGSDTSCWKLNTSQDFCEKRNGGTWMEHLRCFVLCSQGWDTYHKKDSYLTSEKLHGSPSERPFQASNSRDVPSTGPRPYGGTLSRLDWQKRTCDERTFTPSFVKCWLFSSCQALT